MHKNGGWLSFIFAEHSSQAICPNFTEIPHICRLAQRVNGNQPDWKFIYTILNIRRIVKDAATVR